MSHPRNPAAVPATDPASADALPVIAYAVLASLVHEPQSGYQLSQLFGPPRNFMWEAKHSQVYPTLSLLTRRDYVVHTDVEQANRPTKKVYQATPEGRAALREWAMSEPTHIPVRDEFSLRLSAIGLLSPQEAVAMLEQQIALVTSEIQAIEDHLADFAQRFALPDPVPANHRQYGLWSAIRLSCELKKTTVAWYRGMAQDLANVPPSRSRGVRRPGSA